MIQLRAFGFVLALCTACTSQDAAVASRADSGATEPPVIETLDRRTDAKGANMPIPERFHGVWGAIDGNCDPGSDLRLKISAKKLTYYESVGDVLAAHVTPDGQLNVELEMTGEGETWRRSVIIAFWGSEDRLLLVDKGETEQDLTNYRRRCE